MPKFLPADGTDPADRYRVLLGSLCRQYDFSPALNIEVHHVSCNTIDVLIIPAVAVIPHNKQVILSRVIFNPPFNEILKNTRVPHVRLAKTPHYILGQGATLPNVVAVCA